MKMLLIALTPTSGGRHLGKLLQGMKEIAAPYWYDLVSRLLSQSDRHRELRIFATGRTVNNHAIKDALDLVDCLTKIKALFTIFSWYEEKRPAIALLLCTIQNF